MCSLEALEVSTSNYNLFYPLVRSRAGALPERGPHRPGGRDQPVRLRRQQPRQRTRSLRAAAGVPGDRSPAGTGGGGAAGDGSLRPRSLLGARRRRTEQLRVRSRRNGRRRMGGRWHGWKLEQPATERSASGRAAPRPYDAAPCRHGWSPRPIGSGARTHHAIEVLWEPHSPAGGSRASAQVRESAEHSRYGTNLVQPPNRAVLQPSWPGGDPPAMKAWQVTGHGLSQTWERRLARAAAQRTPHSHSPNATFLSSGCPACFKVSATWPRWWDSWLIR